MNTLFRKLISFLKKEWFLFVMLAAIGLIILLFSACRLL